MLHNQRVTAKTSQLLSFDFSAYTILMHSWNSYLVLTAILCVSRLSLPLTLSQHIPPSANRIVLWRMLFRVAKCWFCFRLMRLIDMLLCSLVYSQGKQATRCISFQHLKQTKSSRNTCSVNNAWCDVLHGSQSILVSSSTQVHWQLKSQVVRGKIPSHLRITCGQAMDGQVCPAISWTWPSSQFG